jgi:hypothetical protein
MPNSIVQSSGAVERLAGFRLWGPGRAGCGSVARNSPRRFPSIRLAHDPIELFYYQWFGTTSRLQRRGGFCTRRGCWTRELFIETPPLEALEDGHCMTDLMVLNFMIPNRPKEMKRSIRSLQPWGVLELL